MEVLEVVKKASSFECILCNVSCSRNFDLLRHFKTKKHIQRLTGSNTEVKKAQNSVNCVFKCKCGREYKTHGGLWKHKQKCYSKMEQTNTSTMMNTSNISNDDIIKIILEQSKENKELKDMMMEMMKNQSSTSMNNCNNTNTNTINNHFNINMFLNEKCKNALNLSEFASQIKGSIKDLESIGMLGFVEGVSKIFIRELKNLSVYERPIHCTDVKREKLYVKDENRWEKEDDDKKKIKKAIKNITFNNIKNLNVLNI